MSCPSTTPASIRRSDTLKRQIPHQHFVFLFLFLHQGVLVAAAAPGSEGQTAVCIETAWLSFSTHDLELVAKQHENATVLLQAWGSFNQCLSITFTYDPSNPSIEPLQNFTICPTFPASTSPSSTITPFSVASISSSRSSSPSFSSSSSISSSSISTSSSSFSFRHSSSPHLQAPPPSSSPSFKRCRGCGGDPKDASTEVSISSSRHSFSPRLSPSLPSSPPPSERCRGCGDGHKDTSAEASISTPIHSRSSPLQAHAHALELRGAGRMGRQFSAEDVEVANVSLEIVSRWVGKTVLAVTTNSSNGSCVGVTDAFVRVSVIHTRALDVASDVIGWVYTILWDVSFLPQVWLNWRRKSVEGLSLDNVTLNFVAYSYYAAFNIALLYIPFIKEQFKERYPRNVNHVKNNDIFFAAFAVFIESVLAVQCLLYGRNVGLSVSWPCIALVGASLLAVGVECILVAVGVVWWLDVFYMLSYMKLAITPLKYIPQVYVNYQRRSTEGFSVVGATMDFAGGVMSLLQMFLLSANSNDFASIFTNFSKFGLGVITLIFDVTFFCQYWYYHVRARGYTKLYERKEKDIKAS